MSEHEQTMSQPLKLPPIHKLVSDIAPTSEVLGSLRSRGKGKLPDALPDALHDARESNHTAALTSPDAAAEADGADDADEGGRAATANDRREDTAPCGRGLPSPSQSSASSISSGSASSEAPPCEPEEPCPGEVSGFKSRGQTTQSVYDKLASDRGSAVISHAPGSGDDSSGASSAAGSIASSGGSRASSDASDGGPTDASQALRATPESKPHIADSSQTLPASRIAQPAPDSSEASPTNGTSAEPRRTANESAPPFTGSGKASPTDEIVRPVPHPAAPLAPLQPLEPNPALRSDMRIPVYSFMRTKPSPSTVLPELPSKKLAMSPRASSGDQSSKPEAHSPGLPWAAEPAQQLLPTLRHLDSSGQQPRSGSPALQHNVPQAAAPQPRVEQLRMEQPNYYYPYNPSQNRNLSAYQQPTHPMMQSVPDFRNYSGAYTTAHPYYTSQPLYYAPPRGVAPPMMPPMAGAGTQGSLGSLVAHAEQQGVPPRSAGQDERPPFNSSHPEFHIIDSTTGRHLVAEAPRRRGNLPKDVTNILRRWLTSHLGNPYPTEEDKMRLVEQTGLSLVQVSNWFINARRRSIPASQRRGKNHNYARGGESRSDVNAQSSNA